MTIFSSRRGRMAAALAGIAVSALALSACAGSSDSDSGSTDAATDELISDITIQLSWIKNEEFAGEFFADSNGYYTDAGFSSVTLVPGPSTSAPELISGTADFGLSDAVSTGAVVASEGAPLKIIGTTYQKNPFTILSLADGGNIATVEDMIGKKIGIQDSNTALFTAFLSANGLTTDDVEIVPVQYDPAPLTNGEVDGFMAYLTNEALIVAAEGFDTVNLPFADNGLPFSAETFVTTDDMIANHPSTVKAFLLAEIRGWTDLVNDPAEGARLAYEVYGADLGLDPALSEEGSFAQVDLIVTDETLANGLFTISDELQEATIASLAGAGIVLTAADLFDLTLLNEVYAENPDLIDFMG
ncbi:ABC transporter substrate-binding protein [Microbacterium sediminicola]|uniref:Thiamine pyrimidine synthase n=1 Tax=Microbacterium sediminicola TaxID=415210 RepID=A0ABN2IG25_9MICO